MKKPNKPERVQPNALATANAAAPSPSPTSEAAHTQFPAPAAAGATEMPVPQNDTASSDEPLPSEQQEPAAELGPGRRTRIPFGAAQPKLHYPPRPGFHRHWFRDDPGRVDRAKAAGYEHVIDPVTGQPVSRLGGQAEGGGGLNMYLMEQPQHWHEEDVALGQKPVDDIDRAIKFGAIGREKAGAEANVRYEPDGRGIKITAR